MNAAMRGRKELVYVERGSKPGTAGRSQKLCES